MNLRTEDRGDFLLITGLDRLSSDNAALFKDLTLVQLADAHRCVDVDLSQASFMDSVGIGALVAVLKRLTPRQGRLRLLHPVPAVQGMLTLLRMDQVFEIVPA